MMTEKRLLIYLLGIISILCIFIWTSTKDFRMNQNWEEDAMFYIVGNNFVKYGFWRTKLLDDYAVGSDSSTH